MVTLKRIPIWKNAAIKTSWIFRGCLHKFWTKAVCTETERASPLPFLQQVIRRAWSEAWHATGETGWSRFKNCSYKCNLARNGSVSAFFPKKKSRYLLLIQQHWRPGQLGRRLTCLIPLATLRPGVGIKFDWFCGIASWLQLEFQLKFF